MALGVILFDDRSRILGFRREGVGRLRSFRGCGNGDAIGAPLGGPVGLACGSSPLDGNAAVPESADSSWRVIAATRSIAASRSGVGLATGVSLTGSVITGASASGCGPVESDADSSCCGGIPALRLTRRRRRSNCWRSFGRKRHGCTDRIAEHIANLLAGWVQPGATDGAPAVGSDGGGGDWGGAGRPLGRSNVGFKHPAVTDKQTNPVVVREPERPWRSRGIERPLVETGFIAHPLRLDPQTRGMMGTETIGC